MIRERYSDQVHSGEILDVLSMNGTPACLLDLRMQRVTLNQEMQNTLHIDDDDLSFAAWIQAFNSTAQSGLQQVLHRLLTEGLRETSVQLTDQNNSRKYHCKLVHLTNGQIAFSLKPLEESFTNPNASKSSSYANIIDKTGQTHSYSFRRPILDEGSAQLRASQDSQLRQRMSDIIDKFPHGLAIINQEWEITYANAMMEKVTGIDFEYASNQRLWDIFPIDEYYNFFQNYLRAMENKETVEFEGFIKETRCVVHVTVYPTDLGVTVFLQDVTQYKKHLQALKDSEERFAILANNIKDVFWIADPQFEEFHYISPSFQNMFGVSRRDALSNPNSLDQVVHEEDLEKVKVSLSLMKTQRHQVEYRIKTVQGEQKWIRTRGFPVENAGTLYVLGIHEDITECREMNKLKEKSQQLSTITQMSAGIAHEIKNPLTAIKGFLQIGAANPELRDNYQEIILDEVNRIEAIVQDFMMLSKPKSSIQMEEVEADEVLSYVLRLLEPEAQDKNVFLRSEKMHLEETILTEPKRLNQILINLVKNAIDAVDDGGEVMVHSEVLRNELTLSVSDNGPGLTAQELAKIGEPFFTTKEKGTGLGVMVTKKIVADLNGTISYKSKKGEGTTVTVKLPRQP
ncbi:PAS domain-containing sensor histidine kinase [Halobacillus mangrovi]|nr:PAS domain-containing sensor histidine kinase [Halobacillus mangrovi]